MSNKMALDARGDIRKDMPSSAYKMGDEFKPFHPGASHVRPEWRDGWNACFIAAIAALQAEPQGWRPIETAPLFVPLQDPVPPAILYSKEYGVCMGAAGRDQFGHIYAHITNVSGSVGDIVTHFHALPATPPKD